MPQKKSDNSTPARVVKDKRQAKIDRVKDMVMRGEPLTENEVEEALFLARDQIIMHLLCDALDENYEKLVPTGPYSGTPEMIIKMKIFSKLQHACDRHVEMHPKKNIDKSYVFEWPEEMPDYTYDGPDVEA